MKFRFIALLLFALPLSALASVRINEIAWMGTETSHTDEWIELANAGSELIDITGWRLSADDGSLEIVLDGGIPAGGYFLLERSNDETVPDVSADQIYTGALSNSGEHLTLRDGSGSAIDTVNGSDEWSIGGDNETKETAQRTDTGWITTAPTPNAPNGGASEQEQETDKPTERNDSNGMPSVQSASVFIPEKSISLDVIHAPETTVVGAGARFEAQAFGFEGEPLTRRSARYIWSFGDGGRAEGEEVQHAYAYPGGYTVSVTAVSGKYTASDRFTVSAIPADIRITDVGGAHDFYIEIANKTDVEIDLSRWILSAGDQRFYIPDNTYIQAGYAARFSPDITSLARPHDVCSGAVKLLYPNGERAAAYACAPTRYPISESAAHTREHPAPAPQPRHDAVSAQAEANESEPVPAPTQHMAAVVGGREEKDAPGKPSGSGTPLWLWFLGAGTLSVIGAAGVILAGRKQGNPAEEFDVIEETGFEDNG